MEKHVLDRRLNIMRDEGITFRTNANVGVNISVDDLRRDFDAILLAGGATLPRDLPVPGRELKGIYFAMQFLPLQNKRCEGDTIPESQFISARDKRVVIIGGGDTGADCLGTVHRQGARSVVQFELLPKPPMDRAPDNVRSRASRQGRYPKVGWKLVRLRVVLLDHGPHYVNAVRPAFGTR